MCKVMDPIAEFVRPVLSRPSWLVKSGHGSFVGARGTETVAPASLLQPALPAPRYWAGSGSFTAGGTGNGLSLTCACARNSRLSVTASPSSPLPG
jgi:hypothetical protein